MRRAVGVLCAAFLYAGLVVATSCGTPTYYSSSVGYYGHYGRGGWYDPYYYRPCCHGHRPPDRPHRPPGDRPPGMRPPGSRPPPGMRPPGSRPPHAGRPPSMPSRPRPTPRGGGRR